MMPDIAADKATIQSMNENFARAFNTGDFASMAANYVEDAVILPPGAELMRGRSAIQAFWTSAGEMLSDLKLSAEDVQRLGNEAAREIGTFTAKTKGQPPQDIVGKYVVVWQKVENEWKLATDIWNTNK
jgi:uncharacterized protein (TIGR02246 family)